MFEHTAAELQSTSKFPHTLSVASRTALPKPQEGDVGSWLMHWLPNVLLNDFACHLSLPVVPARSVSTTMASSLACCLSDACRYDSPYGVFDTEIH